MTRSLPANWLPALLIFLAVALGVVSIVFLWEWLREQKRQREVRRQLRGLVDHRAEEDAATAGLFREAGEEELAWLAPVLEYMPHRQDIQILLDRAALPWGVGTFLMLTLGLGFAAGLSALVIATSWVIPLLAAATGASLPYLYVRRRKGQRMRAFEEEFPEAIDLLGRSIRAGHAFATGLKVVADEAEDPVGAEFRQIFEEQKFGLPLEDSMLALADRVALVDVRIFVTAILVQREVGGNLAEILDKISYTIRERFMIQRQVRVYTAQGRLTGYLLAGLPILVGLLIFLLNPEYMSVLFTEPVGRLMLTAAGVMQVVGFLVIRRIIDIEI
ncbi:MAG: type II secretion system F family protein [Gemmatimonadota bacterium]